MKKVVFLLMSFLFAVVSFGQTNLTVESLKSTTDAYLDIQNTNNRSYVFLYGNEVTDTLNASENWDFSVAIAKDYDADLKYEARAALDSISGSPGVSMILQGKYSWNDSWTPLDTVVWSGTDSDTTMVITYATAKNYRFARVYLVSDATAQKTQVERIEFGVYD